MTDLTALAALFAELEGDDSPDAAALERAHKVEAQREYAAADSARQADTLKGLEQILLDRAEGKPWYDGIYPHQWAGIRFGFGAKRWLLGDQMGLGKTRQATGWLDLVQSHRTIVVCQAEIAAQFAGEMAELAPHRNIVNVARLPKIQRHQQLVLAMGSDKPTTIVVNFEMFRRDELALERLIKWHADSVIVDEAHNLKGYKSSANYRYVELLVTANNVCGRCRGHITGLRDATTGKKKVCTFCGWTEGAARAVSHEYPLDRYLDTKSVKYVCFTTGTPILNSPEDIFPLLHLLDPLQFATKAGFTEAFCQVNYAAGGKLEFRRGGLTQLKPMIQNRYIARTLEDAGVVLPPQTRHVVRVDLDKVRYAAQAKVIEQISNHARIELSDGRKHNIMHVMSLITRKRQANVWPAGIEIRDTDKESPTFGDVILSVGDDVQESAKFDAVCENIARIHGEGRRQVVFSQFKTALAALESRLREAGYRVVRYDGDTPSSLRQQIKDDFYRPEGESPRWDIVLAHYRSGGTGLNLQRATATHMLDEEWNPGRRDQAAARTYRMGQTEPTDLYIYRMGGVDTWMANLIRQKERILNDFDSITDFQLANELTKGILEEAA